MSEKERVKLGHIDISVEERERADELYRHARDAGMWIDGWLLLLESSQWVLILALCICDRRKGLIY